jgi:hypothetical protein
MDASIVEPNSESCQPRKLPDRSLAPISETRIVHSPRGSSSLRGVQHSLLGLQGRMEDLPMLDAHKAPPGVPFIARVNTATRSENALNAVRAYDLDFHVTATNMRDPHTYGDVL